MNLFRAIYTSLIILFVFIGNIGINIYTHSCEEDGDFHSVFVKVNHNCDEEKEKPSCCSEELTEADCCKDEVNFYKVKFDFFDHSPLKFQNSTYLFSPKFNHKFILAFQESNLFQYYPTRPPPKPSGQEILLLNQVFRI